MTNERRHLTVRLEVQLRTVALRPRCLESARELGRIREALAELDELDAPIVRDDDPEVDRAAELRAGFVARGLDRAPGCS